MNKKVLCKKSMRKSYSAMDCVKEELKVLQTLEHPNVIWLHEIIDDPKRDNIYLVTEYHSAGCLGDKVKKLNESKELVNRQLFKEGKQVDTRGIRTNKVRTYLIDMIKALYYCH